MKVRTCDSCGGRLAAPGGGDVFFVVRLQITKGTAWGPVQEAAGERMAAEARRMGMKGLADALDRGEPATIVGDLAPSLITHADLRVCSSCVERGATAVRADGEPGGLDLLALIRGAELGDLVVPTPQAAGQ